MTQKTNSKHCCIEKVCKELMDQDSSITSLNFDLCTIRTFIKGVPPSNYKTGQKFGYSFKHTKRNGEVVIKSTTSFLAHTYCPFCGKKY